MNKFNLGQVVATPGADALLDPKTVANLLRRHLSGDWGEMCAEDKALNDESVNNEGRLHSSYKVNNQTIWVITEWDRSVTTFLLPSEY